METGKFNTVIGKLPPETKLGDGNTIVNAADENGNVIINTPMAVGYGAKSSETSISIGAFAGSGGALPLSEASLKPRHSFLDHPLTKWLLGIISGVILLVIGWLIKN